MYSFLPSALLPPTTYTEEIERDMTAQNNDDDKEESMSSSCCHGRADASFFSTLMTTAATKTLLDIEIGIDDNIQIKLPSPNKYLYSMDGGTSSPMAQDKKKSVYCCQQPTETHFYSSSIQQRLDNVPPREKGSSSPAAAVTYILSRMTRVPVDIFCSFLVSQTGSN